MSRYECFLYGNIGISMNDLALHLGYQYLIASSSYSGYVDDSIWGYYQSFYFYIYICRGDKGYINLWDHKVILAGT